MLPGRRFLAYTRDLDIIEARRHTNGEDGALAGAAQRGYQSTAGDWIRKLPAGGGSA